MAGFEFDDSVFGDISNELEHFEVDCPECENPFEISINDIGKLSSTSNCLLQILPLQYLPLLLQLHYVKKHPDYGIEDQKIFINAFVTFIDSELAYFQAKDLTSISRN